MSNRNRWQRFPIAFESGTGGNRSPYTSRAAAVLVRDLQYRRRNQEPPTTSLETTAGSDPTLRQGPGSDVSHLVVRNPDQALIGAVPANKRKGHKRSVQFQLSAQAPDFVPAVTAPKEPSKVYPMIRGAFSHLIETTSNPISSRQDVPSLVETTSRPLYSAQDVRSSDMNNMPSKESIKALPQKLNYTVETLSASAFDKNYPRPTQADYDAYLAALPPDQSSSSNRLTRRPQISDQHALPAQSQPVMVKQDLPETIETLPSTHSADDSTSQAYTPTPSTHCADDSTSQTYPPMPSTHCADESTSQAQGTAPSNPQGNCPTEPIPELIHDTVIRAQASFERWEASGGDDSTSLAGNTASFNSHGNCPTQPVSDPIHDALLLAMKAYKRDKRPDNLDHVKASLKKEQDRLDYVDSQRAASAKDHEALMTAFSSAQANTTTDARQSGASRQMPLVKRTATGHPLPHGSFTNYNTPNGTYLEGTWEESPEPSRGQAASNAMSQSLERRRREDEASLARSVAWFQANGFPYDHEMRAVMTEMQRRDEEQLAGDRAQGAGKAKELQKPIGYERAVAAAARAAANKPVDTSSGGTYDLMKDPRPQDAMMLMSGTIANLSGYADGTHVGPPFAVWSRPAEHAIDNSFDGNKSLFDKHWGSPPARVGRDPRYQQTMTTDGRATYFEDPARGMGRQ